MWNDFLSDWTMWLSIACVLVLVEMFSGTLYLLTTAFGALIGALIAGVGGGQLEQVLGVAVVSTLGALVLHGFLCRLRAQQGGEGTDGRPWRPAGQVHADGVRPTMRDTAPASGTMLLAGEALVGQGKHGDGTCNR